MEGVREADYYWLRPPLLRWCVEEGEGGHGGVRLPAHQQHLRRGPSGISPSASTSERRLRCIFAFLPADLGDRGAVVMVAVGATVPATCLLFYIHVITARGHVICHPYLHAAGGTSAGCQAFCQSYSKRRLTVQCSISLQGDWSEESCRLIAFFGVHSSLILTILSPLVVSETDQHQEHRAVKQNKKAVVVTSATTGTFLSGFRAQRIGSCGYANLGVAQVRESLCPSALQSITCRS